MKCLRSCISSVFEGSNNFMRSVGKSTDVYMSVSLCPLLTTVMSSMQAAERAGSLHVDDSFCVSRRRSSEHVTHRLLYVTDELSCDRRRTTTLQGADQLCPAERRARRR